MLPCCPRTWKYLILNRRGYAERVEAPEFEVESNLQTNAEKEEISEEDLLGLFDDIKEIDMPEKDTSGNQKTPAPDETEMPADGNIMNLFDEIRISELKDEKHRIRKTIPKVLQKRRKNPTVLLMSCLN